MAENTNITEFEEQEKKSLTPQEIAQKWQTRYRGADAMRRKYEPIVFDNLTFVFGDQRMSAYSDVQRFRLRRFNEPRINTKIKAISNQIFPMFRQMQATAVTQMSGVRAVAMAGRPKSGIKLTNDFLRDRTDSAEEQQRRMYEFQESALGGRCLRWPYWDATKGEYGDTNHRTLTFWQFVLPPWHLSSDWLLAPPPWIIIPTVQDVGYIKDTFNVEVKPEDNANADRLMERIVAMVAQGRAWQNASGDERKNSCVMLECIIPPNARYPKGRYDIVCGEQLLRSGELPDGIVPTPIDFFPAPRHIPITMIEMSIGLQRQYNNILSMMLEMSQRQLRGDTIQAGGYEAPKVEYDKYGAQRIILPENVKQFELMKYEFNPLHSLKMMDVAVSDMKAIFGQSDPSLGVPIQGDRTKFEIQALTASDATGMGLLKEIRERAYCKTALDEWRLAYSHYITPRELSLQDERAGDEQMQFIGQDLGEPTAVVPRSMPILSLPEQLERKQQLREAGAFGPYEGDPEKELQGRLMILNSGLPDAEELAAEGSMSIEELKDLVYGMARDNYQILAVGSKARLQQLVEPVEETPMPQEVPMQPQMVAAG